MNGTVIAYAETTDGCKHYVIKPASNGKYCRLVISPQGDVNSLYTDTAEEALHYFTTLIDVDNELYLADVGIAKAVRNRYKK